MPSPASSSSTARFSQLPIEELAGTEIFPCINECILKKLRADIIDHTMSADVIIDTVEKRRTLIWYERLQNFYEGVLEVAYMQKFYLDHSDGFHTVEQHKVWKEYTSDYYKMDTYYRLFHVVFGKSLNSSNPLLDDLFKQVADSNASPRCSFCCVPFIPTSIIPAAPPRRRRTL